MTTALEYHQATAHIRNRPMRRLINWNDQPVPYKLYRNVPKINLPQELALPDVPLSESMAMRQLPSGADMPTMLATVCSLAAGLTRVKKQPDGLVFHFRSIPSAGALYPVELYVALQNVTGISDGLYHFCPLDHTLTPIRQGQVFSALAGEESIIRFYVTTIFHRSAWKYGPRAYRYCLLDAGHMIESLLLAARAHGLPAVADYDFDDSFTNDFLCVDHALEGCVAQIHALGCGSDKAVYHTVPPILDSLPEFSRSARRVDTPQEIAEVHGLCSGPASGSLPMVDPPSPASTRLPEPHLTASISATLQSRRSSRNFVTRDVDTRRISDVLGWLCQGQPDNSFAGSVRMGCIAHTHSGFEPGFHHIDPRTQSTTLVQKGLLTARSAQMCLDQGWLENSALHLTFSARLQDLESVTGPRAYRYAHLEAGRLGQRAYLAATANNLGACGIGAFFDGEAADLLEFGDDEHLLYLVAVGPVKK